MKVRLECETTKNRARDSRHSFKALKRKQTYPLAVGGNLLSHATSIWPNVLTILLWSSIRGCIPVSLPTVRQPKLLWNERWFVSIEGIIKNDYLDR